MGIFYLSANYTRREFQMMEQYLYNHDWKYKILSLDCCIINAALRDGFFLPPTRDIRSRFCFHISIKRNYTTICKHTTTDHCPSTSIHIINRLIHQKQNGNPTLPHLVVAATYSFLSLHKHSIGTPLRWEKEKKVK